MQRDTDLGEQALGVGQNLQASRRRVRLEQAAMARHRADADLLVVLLDVAQLVGWRVGVEHVLGRGQAQPHRRQWAVPAGQKARPRTQAVQERRCVIDDRCPFVVERRRNLQNRLLRDPLDLGPTLLSTTFALYGGAVKRA